MPFRQVTRVSTSIRNSGPRSSSRLATAIGTIGFAILRGQPAPGDANHKPMAPRSARRAAERGPTSRRTPGTRPAPARLLRLSVPVRGRFRPAARPRPAPAAPHLCPPPGTAAPHGAEPPTAAARRDPPRAHRRPPAPRRLPSPALPLPPARSARCSGRSGARRPPPLGIVRGPPAAASGPPRRPPVLPRSPPAPPQPPAPARLRGPVRFLRLRSGERGSGTWQRPAPP